MKIDWRNVLVDVIAAFFVLFVIRALGGPDWAAFGFAYTVYMLHRKTNQ